MKKYSMKTYCVGRFLIDLPEKADSIDWIQRYRGNEIAWVGNTKKNQFQLEMRRREDMLNTTPAYLKNDTMALVQAGDGPVPDSRYFLYYTIDSGGGYYNIDEYRHFELGAGYFKVSSGVDEERGGLAISEVAGDLSPLEWRIPDNIPQRPGVCIDHGFIAGVEDEGEQVSISVHIGKIYIGFDTQAVGSEPVQQESLLRRFERAVVEAYFKDSTRSLRSGSRQIHDYSGEEVGYKNMPNSSALELMKLTWEYEGKPNKLDHPSIGLTLEVSGPPDVSAPIDDDEILGLWDAVLSSVRLRPGAV